MDCVYLLGDRIENTLDGLGMKDRHIAATAPSFYVLIIIYCTTRLIRRKAEVHKRRRQGKHNFLPLLGTWEFAFSRNLYTFHRYFDNWHFTAGSRRIGDACGYDNYN